MSNAVVQIAKDVVIDAEKALSWIRKAEQLTPTVAGGLAVILAAVDKSLSDVQVVAGNPNQALNLQFDEQVLSDLKAVWPAIKNELAVFGVNLP